jgi:filamentous hemagglutinin family protein
MKIHMKTYIFITFCMMTIPLYAEVIFDGSLGPAIELPGQDYQVKSEYGQLEGRNLFHSFREFNLQQHESATFSGPHTINTIISRVTGGKPSQIDGLLRSTIPEADLYFMNPHGILFGKHARLDVQGSFHATTADVLRLQDGGQFNALTPQNSLLTVAPVEAFGFLKKTPASITIEDSRFFVYPDKTLSLIGGNLNIEASQYHKEIIQLEKLPQLFAESGRINLISIASPGEVIPGESDIKFSSDIQGGQIRMHNASISVDGQAGGDIFIRAERFELIDTIMGGNTFGEENGGKIDISGETLVLQGTEHFSIIYAQSFGTGRANDINLQLNQLSLEGNVQIANMTYGAGKGGETQIRVTGNMNLSKPFETDLEADIGIFNLSENIGDAGNINIQAGKINVDEGRMIANGTLGSGKGGDITIQADQIMLNNGGQIFNRTLGAGDAGRITIKVTDTLTAIGEDRYGNESGILGQAGDGELIDSGKAAKISVEARQIKLIEGGEINSDTYTSADGGSIQLKVTETLTLSKQAPSGSPSDISASTLSLEDNAGNAGRIEIEANQILLLDGGAIYNATLGPGNSGAILLNVKEQLIAKGGFDHAWRGQNLPVLQWLPSGIFAASAGYTENMGQAGKIIIKAGQVELIDGGQINNDTFGSGNSGSIEIRVRENLIISGEHTRENQIYPSGIRSSSSNQFPYAGQAGDIVISAQTLKLFKDSEISSGALNAAGGNITITTPDLLYLQASEILTSVKGGEGDGGNITLSHPLLIILDKGEITAEADAGRGGNIRITSDELIKSSDSLISASSRLGIDGEVEINSPEINMEALMVILPCSFIEEATLKECDRQDIENPSTFKILPAHKLPPFIKK